MSKIMLVDDNEVIIDLYERTIENIPDAEVVAVAKNGEEAIEILENNVENKCGKIKPPNIILLDMAALFLT